jgi:exoribonuclease R
VPSQTVSARAVDKDDALAAALAAIPQQLGLVREFPPAVTAEAERIAGILPLPELDRTDLEFVTIDPAGSTDLDQAMCLLREGDGYRVYYAIADVPAFVEPGGAIDAEARRRGQTVYAPDGRIPLHPAVISEGAGSLLPGQLRGAYVWDFELDAAATVTTVRVYRARVTSRTQYDYETAQRLIDDGSGVDLPGLDLLKEVGEKRVKLEEARGGASLRVPETEVEVVDGRYVIGRRSPLPVEAWSAQLSLMTGMAAAQLMLDAGVGVLRTMPPADEEAVARFRRQAAALGQPWPQEQRYGDYLRGLDTADPRQLAIMHAAASLFRGAGYSAFDGALPENTVQAAVAAPYAHVTAPLRRLVDRFALVLCEAVSAGEPVPAWVRSALPELPSLMNASNSLAGQVDNRALDTVEAAMLHDRVGEVFEVTVLSSGKGSSTVQLDEPAVAAKCDGELESGTRARVRLDAAEIASGVVRFSVAHPA